MGIVTGTILDNAIKGLKTTLEEKIGAAKTEIGKRIDALPKSLTEYADRLLVLEEWATEATVQYDEQAAATLDYETKVAELTAENERLHGKVDSLTANVEGMQADVFAYLRKGLDPIKGARTDGQPVDFAKALAAHHEASDDLTYQALMDSCRNHVGEHKINGVSVDVEVTDRNGYSEWHYRDWKGNFDRDQILLDSLSIVWALVGRQERNKGYGYWTKNNECSDRFGDTRRNNGSVSISLGSVKDSEMSRRYFSDEEEARDFVVDALAATYIGAATRFLERGGEQKKDRPEVKRLSGSDFKLVGEAFNGLTRMEEFKNHGELRQFGNWLLDNYSVPGMDTIQVYLAPIKE